MHNRFGCQSRFLDEILHLFTLSHATEAAFSLSRSCRPGQEKRWRCHGPQACRIVWYRVLMCIVSVRRCNTPLKYQPILWELTTCHATTTKTPTSKRPPIHHQKYHSNATATPEKYLANIVKHSIKNISNTAKTFCFSLCLLYFFTNALHGPKTQRHRNKIKAST